MKSIRTYLVLAVVSTLVLLMFAALLKGYSSRIEKTQILFDRQLTHLAGLVAMADPRETHRLLQLSKENMDTFFQIWTLDGRLVVASKNAPKPHNFKLEPGFSYSNSSEYRWRILMEKDLVSPRWIVVGERNDIRLNFAEAMILDAILPVVVGVVVAAILVWFLVGRGLFPLKRLAGELSNKQLSDLSSIELTNAPKELIPLISSVNALFERLAGAFHREQQFSADAAHELRTPIAALKLHAENMQARLAEDDPDAQLLVEGAERMGYVIEQILSLHRTVPDQAVLAFEPVELVQLARTEIAEHYKQFELKQQHVTLSGDHNMMRGNEFALRTLLQNLLSNACKYTPVGGDINISVGKAAACVRLIIADSGVGIPTVKHADVFKRFYRLDNDQHASSTLGCGLGLAIVQHIVTLHYATITLSDSESPTGLTVTVDFPALKEIEIGEKNAA